ncbi:TolC family protein [Novipirellula artificiosorum]|uniref:Outer membrane efflux protein n=1 Tax=Novipirellula artificiosorum TaxID=2528016 RepID=A0A5C6DI57_9BACT|nr:TolC family protein [Novipirellula artificiosorum]TWU35875.1 Outer membrane efflux protein [Novipirellula artificiosorum]
MQRTITRNAGVLTFVMILSGCAGQTFRQTPIVKAVSLPTVSGTSKIAEADALVDADAIAEAVAISEADPIGLSATDPTSAMTVQTVRFVEPVVGDEVSYDETSDGIPMDFQTALAMIGGDHPTVAAARYRVQAAYAELQQAEVLWLPSIQIGGSLHRHDGTLQASNGSITDVNRNSLQAGLGAGAVGAGSTPQPGIVAQFHFADAIFQPRIAQRTVWARQHGRTAVYNAQLRDAAVAYNRLLAAKQRFAVLMESEQRLAELTKLTTDFAESGEGLRADVDRTETEQRLVEGRLEQAKEQISVASFRLAEALSLQFGMTIEPTDPMMVPIELRSTIADPASNPDSLIAIGLSNRPELKEANCLVAEAIERYQREKSAPMVPSVILGLSQTGFGGGLGDHLGSFHDRTDLDVLAVWQIRNLGFGDRAAACRAAAISQQVRAEQIRQMDRVAREVAEANAQIGFRDARITIAQKAIGAAENSKQRNLDRIRDGQGIPLEALQSLQALEAAQMEYIQAVTEHNEAQFQLQWALGWPIT